MISSETEYRKAREEIEHLTRWLARLENREVAQRKGLTSAGIRRMISRVQEEIAQYEAAGAPAPARPEDGGKPEDPPRTEPPPKGPD